VKSVGDLADAKAQLKIADADHVSCSSEVKIHKSSIASLQSKLAQCETDKKSCNEARDAAVKRVQALDKESTEFRHMIKELSQNHDAKVGDLLKQLASAQSSVDRLTVRASDCDTKVLLASSDAQKLHSQISAQEAVIKAKDTVIKTDEQKIQALTRQKKELEADMTAHRAATEAKLAAEAKHVADWKAKAEAEAKDTAYWKTVADEAAAKATASAEAGAHASDDTDAADDSDANDGADEAEAAATIRRYSRHSPSNRSYSPSTFHARLFSRYQNYCRGSRTGRKVHICVVIDMLEHKLANSEISMIDVDRDLETMLSDLGN